jgi:hypothetical protein
MSDRDIIDEYLKKRVAAIEEEYDLPEITVFRIRECFHCDYSLIVKDNKIFDCDFQAVLYKS